VLPHETSDIAVATMIGWAENRLLGGYLPYEPYRGQLADVVTGRLGSTPPGSSLQLAVARGVVRLTNDVDLLKDWLAGTGVPEGLAVDADLRWLVMLTLARLGAIGDADIDAELERDKTSEGIVHAAECRAALPTPEAKERAWAVLMTDPEVANYELYAVGTGFWHPTQAELTAPYVERFFAEIGGTGKFRSGWVVASSTRASFPRYAIDERTVRLAGELAADEEVAAGIRRAVADHRDDISRALAVRAAYPEN
jgi:aminopeptidase N